MKNRSFVISAVVIGMLSFTATVYAVEEKDLPHEVAPPERVMQNEVAPSIVFTGFVNSKDVSIIAGVIGAVYNFCAEPQKDFCSDEQGLLVVGAENTGKIPEMLKQLDEVIANGTKIEVRLTQSKYFGGARRIMDIRILEE